MKFAIQLGILLAFQILSKLNIQNGGLHWPVRGHDFDFLIAITFLPYIRF